MNPAALKANLGARCSAARRSSSTRTRSASRDLQKAGYDEQPARGRHARRLRRQADPDDARSRTRAVEAIEGVSTRDAQKAKNLFALGVLSWLYDRPTDVTERLDRGASSRQARPYGGQPGRVPRRLELRRDVRADRRAGTSVDAGDRRRARARTATSTAPTATALGLRRRVDQVGPAAGARRATRSRPPPSCCTSSRATRTWACARSRPRTRSPPPSMALGAAFGGALGVTAHERPGHGPQDGDDRPGRDARAADGRSSTSSAPGRRRACRPRPSSRTCCRRSTAATASRRCRWSPPSTPGQCFEAVYEAARIAVTYRTPVILLSDLFLANSSEPWRIPRRGRRCRRSTRASARRRPTATPFLPYARDDNAARGRGRSPARPASRTGSAGWRRQDGTGDDLLRRRQPRAHDRAARGRRSPASTVPAARGRRRRRTPTCSCSAGARATARSAPARAACARAARRVATAHLHHLNPLPAEHRRGAARLRARAACRR